MQTDFFGMSMICIDVINEVNSTSEFNDSFPERDWMEFRNAVTWLEKTRDREEMSLAKKTYQKFKNSFAAISEENSDNGREHCTRFYAKVSPPDAGRSVNQDGPTKSDPVGPLEVEWWPRSNLLSPVELLRSRVFLSLAILFLLGSIFCFLDSLHSLLYRSFRPGAWLLTKDIPVLFLFLSILFFAVWAVLRLWFKVRRRSRK